MKKKCRRREVPTHTASHAPNALQTISYANSCAPHIHHLGTEQRVTRPSVNAIGLAGDNKIEYVNACLLLQEGDCRSQDSNKASDTLKQGGEQWDHIVMRTYMDMSAKVKQGPFTSIFHLCPPLFLHSDSTLHLYYPSLSLSRSACRVLPY